MLKRILAVATIAAMIFAFGGIASAASFSDTAGTARESAINQLAGLGIFNGYPDGTFKPGNPITRAEISKIIVLALGLGDAADMMVGVPSGFSDVATDHWANGYIAVAASQGIVKGDPAGTFRPDANVTYAEAVTMIMRALGYDPILATGVWPTAYLTKAANIGVTSSVAFTSSANATRGDVAKLLSNSLSKQWLVQTGFGENPQYEVSKAADGNTDTFLEAMSCDKVEGWLVDSPELFANDGETLQVAGEAAVTMVDGAAYAGLLGHKVALWLNGDGDCFFIEDKTAASDVREGTWNATTNELEVGDDTWTAAELNAAGASLWTNLAAIDAGPLANGDFAADYVMSVVFDGDDPLYIVASHYTSKLVDSISTAYEKVIFQGGGSLTLKDYDVQWSGDVTDLNDLEEYDVVQYFSDPANERAVIVTTRDSVSGTYTRLSGTTATVGGTKYKADVDYALPALLGDDVTIYLNKDGKIQLMETAEADTTTYTAVITAVGTETDAFSVDTAVVKLVGSDGEAVTLKGTSKFDVNAGALRYDSNADGDWADADDEASLTPGDVIKYELNSSGKMSVASLKAEFVPEPADMADTANNIQIDADNALVTTAAGTYKLTSSTVIFNLSDFVASDEDVDAALDVDVTDEFMVDPTKDETDISIMTLDDLLANDSFQGFVAASSGKATVVAVLSQTASSDTNLYGYVVSTYAEDGENGVVILANGEETEYLFSDNATFENGDDAAYDDVVGDIVAGKLVKFDVASGEIAKIAIQNKKAVTTWDASVDEVRVTDVSSGVLTVTGFDLSDDDTFDLYMSTDEDTQFIDISGDDPVGIGIEDVALDSVVDVYMNGNVVAAIVVK